MSLSRMPSTGLRVQLGGLDQARVHVHRALRRSGRAGGVEPEADVVAGGRRGLERGGGLSPSASCRCRCPCASLPETMTCLRKAGCAQDRREARQQRLRDDQRARAAVPQHELVVGRGEQRVGRDRHDAGLDRAEEHARESRWCRDGASRMRSSISRPRPVSALAARFDALGELAVGVAPGVVDVGDLAGAPRADCARSDRRPRCSRAGCR